MACLAKWGQASQPSWVRCYPAALPLCWAALPVWQTARLLRIGSSAWIFRPCAGPSGAGKSTLLNALSMRLDKGATMEGKVRLNGQPYSLATLKRIARCGQAFFGYRPTLCRLLLRWGRAGALPLGSGCQAPPVLGYPPPRTLPHPHACLPCAAT